MSDLFTPYTQIQDYDGGIFQYWYDKFGDNPNPYPLLEGFVTSSNYVDLDTDYLEVFSSEKYLSRVTIRHIEYYIHNNYGDTRNIYDLLPGGRFTQSDKNDIIQWLFNYVADLIYNRFAYKWKKMYDALTTEYEPLENYNMYQKRTPDITREDTYDTTDERTPNLTTSGEDSAKTDVGIHGFNSTSGNSSTDSNGESSSSQSVTGTDTNTKTGTITNTESGTEELERSGNIGVTTSQQMLESELKLREYDFYKTIYKDIDSILCLAIY